MFSHTPVLLNECLEALNLRDGKIYVDCTLGGAGHSREILKKVNCKLVGIDKDADAIEHSKQILTDYKTRVIFVKDDFNNIREILQSLKIEKVDGILIDLGVSSYQIDNHSRGFSYMAKDAPLDMRMDKDQYLTAFNVVNEYGEGELIKILSEHGEEKFAKKIACSIVKTRQENSIRTCGQLVEIIEKSIPAKFKTDGHPAKRTFQAIRIEVNDELSGLKQTIKDCVKVLNIGGRLCVITFHSLEDRIVKHTFIDLETSCVCNKKIPVCVCNKVSEGKILTNKPIEASLEEISRNSRSKSAKLRIIEKV